MFYLYNHDDSQLNDFLFLSDLPVSLLANLPVKPSEKTQVQANYIQIYHSQIRKKSVCLSS